MKVSKTQFEARRSQGKGVSAFGVGGECVGVCFGVCSGEFEWEGRVFE